MVLDNKGLQNREAWEKAGYQLPKFDRNKVAKLTKEKPVWIHFGAGNIFRAFQANLVQQLLDSDKMSQGLIVAEGYDREIVEKVNRKNDDLSILVTLCANGSVKKKVIASIVESLVIDSADEAEFKRLKEIFKSDSLQMVSFTITEKGYSIVDSKGNLLNTVEQDFKNGPAKPISYIGNLVSLVYERFLNGKKPLALVSMDNCSHNGTKLYDAVSAFANKWIENGFIDKGFAEYIDDPKSVSFPWTMIDKITPRPDSSIEKILKDDNIEDIEPIVTSKNTYVAPFVNAEESQYLVIEDSFPNGRPKLEDAGVIFTDKTTVDRIEKMKVCTCLNPLHTALAVFGCLLSYNVIHDEMKDEQLKKLVEIIGYKEGLPVVVNPEIINPKDFIDEVLNIRIPNPFMTDTPQRIATDTSQKLAIRFGETIKAYISSSDLNVSDLKMIPLVFAGWCRYLMGIDDNGQKFELSPDPMLDTLTPYFSDVKLGTEIDSHKLLMPILSNAKIFGVDLYKAGLGVLVGDYFSEMIAGKGAVRATLEKYVK